MTTDNIYFKQLCDELDNLNRQDYDPQQPEHVDKRVDHVARAISAIAMLFRGLADDE